jgi:hypothetical protein
LQREVTDADELLRRLYRLIENGMTSWRSPGKRGKPTESTGQEIIWEKMASLSCKASQDGRPNRTTGVGAPSGSLGAVQFHDKQIDPNLPTVRCRSEGTDLVFTVRPSSTRLRTASEAAGLVSFTPRPSVDRNPHQRRLLPDFFFDFNFLDFSTSA